LPARAFNGSRFARILEQYDLHAFILLVILLSSARQPRRALPPVSAAPREDPQHRRTDTESNPVTRSKIDDLLAERHRGFSPLQKLLRQAADQEAWTAQLQALLPDPLSRECRVVDIHGPVVIVACSSAASATRLRFMAPDLLLELAQLADFRAVQDIRIRVSSA
jgi:predicted nucleic acid-binding Zn ribbon protein